MILPTTPFIASVRIDPLLPTVPVWFMPPSGHASCFTYLLLLLFTSYSHSACSSFIGSLPSRPAGHFGFWLLGQPSSSPWCWHCCGTKLPRGESSLLSNLQLVPSSGGDPLHQVFRRFPLHSPGVRQPRLIRSQLGTICWSVALTDMLNRSARPMLCGSHLAYMTVGGFMLLFSHSLSQYLLPPEQGSWNIPAVTFASVMADTSLC